MAVNKREYEKSILKSSGFAFVMLVAELNFVVDAGEVAVGFFAISAVEFVDSVVDFDFLAVFWVCYVDSGHTFIIIINFEICIPV